MSRVHSLPVAWRLDSLNRSTKRGEADECLSALESLGFDVDSRPLSIGERGELQIRANRRRCAILIPPRVATRVCSRGRKGSSEPLIGGRNSSADEHREMESISPLQVDPRAETLYAPPPRFCFRAARKQSVEQSRRSSGAKYNLRHEFSGSYPPAGERDRERKVEIAPRRD